MTKKRRVQAGKSDDGYPLSEHDEKLYLATELVGEPLPKGTPITEEYVRTRRVDIDQLLTRRRRMAWK